MENPAAIKANCGSAHVVKRRTASDGWLRNKRQAAAVVV
jgi:hypothetical protein